MKIRSGFVSNSSSSSFIIDFFINKDEFYKIAKENFDITPFKEKIKEDIEFLKVSISNQKEEPKNPEELTLAFLKGSEERLRFSKDTLTLLDKDPIKAYMDFYNIKSRITSFGQIDKISFTFDTCMHNYYVNSIPYILQELAFFISAEKLGIVEITRIDTH